ncbi:MAG: FAD binding domain-containing protein [Alphaproteobacteria bacterium]|nr:FAD binding domain-containing protein [Alphaproteobacteria bacterium]
MKPAPFEFRAPVSLDGVLEEMREHGEAARILAGGQSLVPLMNLRMLQPSVLVSINHCKELSYIRAEEDGLVCGALARQWDVEHDQVAIQRCPLLVQALHHVGARSNRNRGTVCGSLAHADPLAELPAVALALDADMIAASSTGRRVVPAREFFVGALENSLRPDEILEAVRFPYAPTGSRSCFIELGNRNHGFAIAGVALEVTFGEDGRCRRARLAVMGGENIAKRASDTEVALAGSIIDEAAAREAGRLTASLVDVAGDFHADAAYRRELVAVLVERALIQVASGAAGRARSI